ncbi:Oidioi.mRNA.OKI2018_I69.chr2.g4412.t1.cds [Oikopleura dioica]|uniref:Oidioi.mRNA.OKI2018_I69.chr2.g4412.t1.cds n=1 Tax=Oikopleura dioica TaxID=34765 RepID=A0ABN7SXA7_OIKDI|nr:Oidioi.mRNA.OKI2018_I69.chr2.g4412.t1.cds [Oikopleura dioica]
MCIDINECLFGMHDCDLKSESCQNSEGSYICVPINGCSEGFVYNSDWKRCEDIDECKMNSSICQQQCTNTEGSFFCECNEGYEQSSRNAPCYDIDECEENEEACGENSICENSPGSFSCSCLEGFVLKDGNCKSSAVNECLLGTHTCDENANCIDTKNSFNCQCNPGFLGDGDVCDDMDECALRSGDEDYCDGILENSACVNTVGSFECQCKPGYFLKNDQCEDIDECASTHLCPSNSFCVNTIGSAHCECFEGFEERDGFCEDINECQGEEYPCDENARCTNTVGSYECACRGGYFMKEEGGKCEKKPINECVQKTHNCDQVCNDEVIGFSCSCFPGYKLAEIGGNVCEDSDECLEENTCGEHQKCTNSIGSFDSGFGNFFNKMEPFILYKKKPCRTLYFACHCNSGYESTSAPGEPKICEDINECTNGENRCDEVTQICQNLAGSYECICKHGFEISSEGESTGKCADINECEMEKKCPVKTKCVNSFGFYSCPCLPGYEDNLDSENSALEFPPNKCIDIDECAMTDVCHTPNTVCSNLDGSFECSCAQGFMWSADSENDLGTTCADVDECDQHETGQQACGANQKCTNTVGSYTCSCSVGYEKSPFHNPTDQFICIDIDECSLNTTTFCGPFSICHNNDGSYDCSCIDGFQMNMTSSLCEDVDECAEEDTENPICQDIDECSTGLVTCLNGMCLNQLGSFDCECNEGFFNDDDSYDCVDVDECATASHDCSPRGNCSNTVGSFTCACPSNLIGDGFKCVSDDDPYDVELADDSEEATVDICDFGVVKFSFSIKELFDRTVKSLCLEVFSSDDLARTDPQIIRDVKGFTKYEVALLADLTDVNERPYISVCPCNQTCQGNDLFINMIDDECYSQSSQAWFKNERRKNFPEGSPFFFTLNFLQKLP